MVYNPPFLKHAGPDGAGPVEPNAVIVATPPARREAYIEQAKRAAVWSLVLIVGWLLMRLACHFDLPPDCSLPNDALEVLTDLAVLLIFGLVQSWLCEIMEERRFNKLRTEAVFPVAYFGTGLVVSALLRVDFFMELKEEPRSGWTTGQWVVSVIALIIVAFFVIYHFAEAWRVLPGGFYVSGKVPVKFTVEENFHRIYNVSRGLILLYFSLYFAFAYEDNDGWYYHYILLAWVLSLFAQFKARASVVWLGITTGVWVAGHGAYGPRWLCQNND